MHNMLYRTRDGRRSVAVRAPGALPEARAHVSPCAMRTMPYIMPYKQVKGFAMTALKPHKAAPRTAAPASRPRAAAQFFPAGLALPLFAGFMNPQGVILAEKVAECFGMSKGQLAETIGFRGEALYKLTRAQAPKTQHRLKEMLEIVSRVADWAGGAAQAMAWYRAQPIAAFGGRTAEALVKDGQADALRDYLDHIATGGFA